MKNKRRKWRIIPLVSYTNWRKQPNVPKDLFREWFSCRRSWGGRIINIRVKHHMLTLDFRYSWLADMANYD